jgi:GNAT superfamily N-acetyltransferase
MTASAPQTLSTGWEQHAPDGDTLLCDTVRNLAAFADHLASTCGGRSLDADGVHLGDLGSVVPFVNRAVLTRPPTAAALAALPGRLDDFYGRDRDPGRPGMLASAWPLPDLAPEGFVLMGHPPLMARPAGPTAAPPVPGLEIREAATAADLEVLQHTIVEAYPFDVPGAREPVLVPQAVGGALRLWVGWYEGRPVATALSFVAHGVNQIEWISTRAEVRGRGIGAAITAAAVDAAPDLPAVLTSSDLGRPVYERLGFLSLCRFTLLLFTGVRA